MTIIMRDISALKTKKRKRIRNISLCISKGSEDKSNVNKLFISNEMFNGQLLNLAKFIMHSTNLGGNPRKLSNFCLNKLITRPKQRVSLNY